MLFNIISLANAVINNCSSLGCLECKEDDTKYCISCDVSNHFVLLNGICTCQNNFRLIDNKCILKTRYTHDTNKSLHKYDEVQDKFTKISDDLVQISDDTKKPTITINLQEIKEVKPYYYSLYKQYSTVIINNKNIKDFAISTHAALSEKNVYLTIKKGEGEDIPNFYFDPLRLTYYDLNLEGVDPIFIGDGSISLNKEHIVKKIICSSSYLTFSNSGVLEVKDIEVINDRNGLKLLSSGNVVKNLVINSQLTLTYVQYLSIENLQMNSGSVFSSDSTSEIYFKNIEINLPEKYNQVNILSCINAYASKPPESIKINWGHGDKLAENEKSLFFYLVFSSNPTFAADCQKWADLYNNNPTDNFLNHAECLRYHTGDYTLIINNTVPDDSKGKGKNKAGIIAGSVVAAVVVVGVVVGLLVYFLVIKKKKDNNSSAQEADNAGNDSV